MILGYEDPVQMPTMDIYSTDLMKTYIAGVKDLYDRGQQEYKDFMKAYQDFYSPVPGANEEYYNATIGGAQKLIQQLQDQGIDPFKSREGRAAIRNYIYGVPIGRLNEMKNEAEAAQEYIKSRDKLISEGKFDPLTDAVLGGGSLENWDRSKGPWTRRYAIENKSLGDLTSTFYDKLQKDERLGPDTSRGKDAGFYDLWGVSENTLQTADAAALEALKQTPYYQLFRQKASGYEDDEHNPIDPDQVLLRQIRHTNEKYWAQPESKRNEMAVDRWKEARSDARARSSSSSGNGSGGKQNHENYSYFNAAFTDGLRKIQQIGNNSDIQSALNNIVGVIEKSQYKDHKIADMFTYYANNDGFKNYLGNKIEDDGTFDLNNVQMKKLLNAGEIKFAVMGKTDYNKQHVQTKKDSFFKKYAEAANDGRGHSITTVGLETVYPDGNYLKLAVPVRMSYVGKDGNTYNDVFYYPIHEATIDMRTGRYKNENARFGADSKFSIPVANKDTKIIGGDDNTTSYIK